MQTIQLPDGRTLAYREYGPAAGSPLIFLPGAGCGRLMRFGDDSLLAAYGVRLFSVDRPGLGSSSADADKSLGSVASDLAHLMAVVSAQPVVVIANSQGAPFGLALARYEQVRSLVLASPIDDLGHPPTTALLGTPHRAFVRHVADEPAAAETNLQEFGADDLYRMVMSGYPASDAPTYGRPEFQAMFRSALADGFGSGAAGYARDTVLATLPWPAELFDRRVPVSILYGADDDAHSPDHAATLAHRLGARRQIVDGVGGSLLWARPELVLDSVRRGH
ncbi:alpha/beta fold hydrolase [Mycolicibacterium bacteremicum]|uniref:alpha/beta fold hydrolase n=1 Tax=Mycolicibacterium bacteremicum TaxID=564198 RepID=UPI0026F096D4|nr:alpha/beta hydrolase [Mycolicibacterium bacteremicum]